MEGKGEDRRWRCERIEGNKLYKDWQDIIRTLTFALRQKALGKFELRNKSDQAYLTG